ncbi:MULTISPECIES: DUF4142 domain-containing protein [unclassified Microcoleus]|uniref:DUF4142 domain-containing protein n=1 Tax=unclassified Microcoleus TaxID=2642155 RepID=UPI002FD2AEAE
MTSLNRKSLFQKLVTVAGIAGVSSSIAVPGFAELNRQSHGFNLSGDRVFELAQNDSNNLSPSDSPIIDPNNNNNPGRSPNTPNSPNNNNNPGSSSDTPNSPSNNNNPGRSPNSPRGENSPNSLSSRDKNFVMQAAQTGMLEVQLGRLAVQRGSSASVKQYGQQMVDEHTQKNQELMQLAMQKGQEVPTEMSSQNKALSDRLSRLSGTSFDAAYKQAMIDSHNQAIALFQAQSQQGQEPELKAWAAQTLPNLQAHLQMVNQMLADTTQQ